MWQLGHITINAEAPTRQCCSGPDAFILSYLMDSNTHVVPESKTLWSEGADMF